MKRTLLLLLGVYACAQSGIEVPSIGAIVDASGSLRPVHGVMGNFLLGPATRSGVLSAACSEQLCLAKADSKIFSATGETDAPPGPAVIGLNGIEAILFFPEPRRFVRWREDVLDLIDWKVDGEVLSIRGTEIAVRRGGSVWIVSPEGGVIDRIAETTGPVLLLAEGVLFATADEVVLRRRNGGEKRFELAGAEAISAMGTYYVAIRTRDTTYALRTDQGREMIFELPRSSP